MASKALPINLARLAAKCGVATEYRPLPDHPVPVPEATIRAVLTSLGFPAHDDDAVTQALTALEAEPWERIAPHVVVGQQSELPTMPILAPEGSRRMWGVCAQVYAAPSRESWGLGDFADLGTLAEITAGFGADFLLVNPMHAAEPGLPITPSPYLPVSRAFLNASYIRPERIPEFADAPERVKAQVAQLATQARAAQEATGLLDWDGAWAAKREALELVFALPRSRARGAGLRAFRKAKGRDLEDFALWSLLADTWPGATQSLPEARDVVPGSEQARELAAAHAGALEFHCWLQWVAAEQLAEAQSRANAAGMRIGVIGDLAVSSHPAGADSWIYGDLLASGVEVGAPPNGLSAKGQGWSARPWNPRKLAQAEYLPFRHLLRTALENTGGLRIDHILGFFRLWWIPEGNPPEDGAFVAYDTDALLGILAQEAQRSGAVVIGEDLGLLEPGYRETLAERGIIGNTVVWFASEDDAIDDGGFFGTDEVRPGEPLAPSHFRRSTLALLTTHDLPPTASIVSGWHIDERIAHGVLEGSEEAARTSAAAQMDRMREFLTRNGFLGEDHEAVVDALHRYLIASNSILAGVGLPDLVGQRESQNIPGTFREYPNWQVPLRDASGQRVWLEDLAQHPRVAELVAVIREAATP